MLTIDQNQIDRISRSVLCESIRQILIDSFPEEVENLASEKTKLEMLEQFKNAEAYGIGAELDIGRYVITAWLLGPDFDTKHPTMNTILQATTADATQKMDAIEQITESIFEALNET